MKKIQANDPCWCKSGKPYCECHREWDRKIDTFKRKFHKVPPRKIIKNEETLKGMRESSKINIACLDYVAANIKAGMTTEDIDKMVYETTTKMGGIPAPLNYEGFPKSVCTSLNNQVCHGIPSDKIVIEDGDIINVDCSTILNGFYSDSSRMFCIGDVSPEHKKLVDVAKECVELGLKQVKPWGHLGDVAQAIQDHARANGYSVVREVGGHGIGLEFHEEPFVSYVIKKGTGMVMAPGMVFTIEPMINEGAPGIFIDDSNGWTIYTDDDSYSAQWEIMVLVTEDGYEVLTY
ncbi:type I methionyl aminopeptidase [Lachnospira multipara]|uniref:type I methionyl aminopeptidase n=1 Tax=Lachnospira multipara TaxID=28051 RepID=UPI0004E0F482|nr:type I methionyl aminopeptidase [Lachnospira multipara]